MTRVHSFTSKVGYYTSQGSGTIRSIRPDGSVSSSFTGTALMGISYKSPTQSSDGHKPTDYSRSVIRAVADSFDMVYKRDGYKAVGDNSFYRNWQAMNSTPWGQLSLHAGSVSPSSYLRLNAIAGAVKKLHAQQAFILEDLAQSAKTAREVYDLFKSILKKTGHYLGILYSAMFFWESGFGVPTKRGGPKRHRTSADGWIRKLANAWLAWYYGIKPLISTINAFGKAESPRFRTLKAVSKQSSPLDPKGLYKQADPLGTYYTYEGQCKEETTCCLIVDCKMSTNLAALANLGFRGGGNPFADGDDYGPLISDGDVLVLGWALLPYSFVVDWLIPVEQFLSTLVWSPGITYKGGYITDYMGGESTCSANNGAAGYYGKMPKTRIEACLFQREAYNSYPPPAALAVNQGISPVNAFNAAALLLQR